MVRWVISYVVAEHAHLRADRLQLVGLSKVRAGQMDKCHLFGRTVHGYRQTLKRRTKPFRSIARRDRSWLAALV